MGALTGLKHDWCLMFSSNAMEDYKDTISPVVKAATI
jgi:hypothetical protein